MRPKPSRCPGSRSGSSPQRRTHTAATLTQRSRTPSARRPRGHTGILNADRDQRYFCFLCITYSSAQTLRTSNAPTPLRLEEPRPTSPNRRLAPATRCPADHDAGGIEIDAAVADGARRLLSGLVKQYCSVDAGLWCARWRRAGCPAWCGRLHRVWLRPRCARQCWPGGTGVSDGVGSGLGAGVCAIVVVVPMRQDILKARHGRAEDHSANPGPSARCCAIASRGTRR